MPRLPSPPPTERVARLQTQGGMSRGAAAFAMLVLLAAAAANVAYLAAEPLEGMLGADALTRIVAAASAAAAALGAGWIARRTVPRVLLAITSILLLVAGGIAPVLAVGAPVLLVVLSALARDVAEMTRGLPALRVRLIVLVSVGLAGPPLVALSHLIL